MNCEKTYKTMSLHNHYNYIKKMFSNVKITLINMLIYTC